MGEQTHWVVMPFVGLWEEYTKTAIEDCLRLAMRPDVHVLAISNGSDQETDWALKHFARDHERVHPWIHNPALPSLAATWNMALDFVFSHEGHALVVNNDVRLSPMTYAHLLHELNTGALFVSATGVREDAFQKAAGQWSRDKGGPDFSCFMISKQCHQKYRFDEGFVPAYCEDLDFHRRMMLGGDAERIYSINLPFQHFSTKTLKEQFSQEKREAFEKAVTEGARKHYERKWGGPVNEEATIHPFSFPQNVIKPCGCVTTPELQFCKHGEEENSEEQ